MIYLEGFGAINGSARFLTPTFEITPAAPLTCVRSATRLCVCDTKELNAKQL